MASGDTRRVCRYRKIPGEALRCIDAAFNGGHRPLPRPLPLVLVSGLLLLGRLREHLRERLLQNIRLEPSGASALHVDDAPVFPDEVGAHGRGRIGLAGGVVHPVDKEGHLDLQALATRARDLRTLFEFLRLVEDDLVATVRVRLPAVLGMRLEYVDEEELGPVLVCLEDFRQVADPAARGRSRVAAEDENDRAFPAEA